MPTISAKVSKRELHAIQEYANACGESISNPTSLRPRMGWFFSPDRDIISEKNEQCRKDTEAL